MNESEIEKQLRSIAPARPSRSLEERIARDLAPQHGHAAAGVFSTAKPSWLARLLPAFGWAGAGAAAAVITMLSFNHGGGAKQEDSKPAVVEMDGDVQHEMLEIADEGILDDGASGPARVLRYTTLERRQWSEPGGAITLVEVPREDVVLVPVSFQ